MTVGVKLMKFWTQVGGGFTSKRGIFGSVGALDTMLSVVFGRDGCAYSGSASGQIFKYEETCEEDELDDVVSRW